MSEPSSDFIILHDDFNDCLSKSNDLPLSWKALLTKEGKSEALGLRFLTESATAFEKRYLESVDQRVRLAEAAGKHLRGRELAFSCDIEQSRAELACRYVDGESLVEFVPRQNHLDSGNVIQLLLDLITELKIYVDYPRILSNIQLNDFAVFAEDGVRLRARLRIASALLKTESPMSDSRLWEFWRDEFNKVASTSFLFSNSESKRDRKHPLVSLSRKVKALFKSFDKRNLFSLTEKFDQLELLLRSELLAFEEKSGQGGLRILNSFEFPRSTITKLIRKEFSELSGDNSHDLTATQSRESFSGFVTRDNFSEDPEKAETVLYFTTPEHWFSHSVIETINRKMTSPFLKEHHNGIRIRSMTCESTYTCLFSDEEFGIPLPCLLMSRSGLETSEILSILHKIHRAMAQFETADFPLELRSPWQIQLHLDNAENAPQWQTLVEIELEKWPAWDIRIRAETPPEHYLTRNSWHSIYNRLTSKFFPSLTTWMFDWKRFTWSNEHTGNWDNEPFNWETKMNNLIQTAGTHLNEKEVQQRQKFLQLIEEVVSSS